MVNNNILRKVIDSNNETGNIQNNISFMKSQSELSQMNINLDYIQDKDYDLPNIAEENKKRKFYLETYGCQMNENDSEIISTILQKNNFLKVEKMEDVKL